MVPPGKIGAGTVRAFLKDLFSGPDREISPVCLNNNFGMGPTNHVLDGDRDPPQKGAIFGGRAAHSKALAVSATVFAAKSIVQYAGKQQWAPDSSVSH